MSTLLTGIKETLLLQNYFQPTDAKHILDNQKIIYCLNCGENELIYDCEYSSYICLACGSNNGIVLSNCSELTEQKFDKSGTSDTSNNIRGKPEFTNKLYLTTRGTRLGKIHNRTNFKHKEYSIRIVYEKINRLFKEMIDKTIINDAYELYCSIYKNSVGSFKGSGFLGACLYFSSIKHKKPIELTNISLTLKCSEKNISKYYGKLLDHIHTIGDEETDKLDPLDFAEMYMEKLNMDDRYKNEVREVLKNIKDGDLNIKNNAKTIAAGSINLISLINSLGIDKKEISNISDLSDVTVYKCTNFLLENMDKLGIQKNNKE
jgi:transcription initiation factor TFIIIB Brf1 subunit/transcription initiation factor TFIIB